LKILPTERSEVWWHSLSSGERKGSSPDRAHNLLCASKL